MPQRLVYLVDDDMDVRRALAFELAGHGVDAWPFSDGSEFLQEIGRLRPACLLVDMGMPNLGGLDLIAEMERLDLHWPVIALSGRHDIPVAVEAMKRGATDFLEKPVDSNALMRALERAFTILDQRIREQESRQAARERFLTLTAREFDVSAALFSGNPNKAVAHRLGISVRTVEKHRASIMAKLGVRSLAEAVVIASQAGVPFGQRECA
jgi:two-component system response regulator FixJ